MRFVYALAAIVSVALAVPASAATVSVVGVVQDGDYFTNVLPAATSGNVGVGVSGSAPRQRDLYEGTTLAGNPFNNIKRNGSMTYSLSGYAGSAFALIIGSVGRFNFVTLNGKDGVTDVVTGAEILALPGYVKGMPNVILKIVSDIKFSSVTLSSRTNSFEHSFNPPEIAPVPVPAAGLLLLAAMGGLGIAARRRKSA